MKQRLSNLRRRLLAGLQRYPGLNRGLYLLLGANKRLMVRPDTELVIEGFPRSANTYAVVAFEQAQPGPVRLAHHVHSPFQVAYAVDKGIPSLVLARDPLDATASLLVRDPSRNPRECLHNYVTFYETLLPLAQGYVVGLFDVVVADYGRIIQAVNERFGTDFALFESTEANVAQAFQRIDKVNVSEWGELSERAVARPAQRGEAKQALRQEISADTGLRPLAERAGAAFQKMAQIAERQGVS